MVGQTDNGGGQASDADTGKGVNMEGNQGINREPGQAGVITKRQGQGVVNADGLIINQVLAIISLSIQGHRHSFSDILSNNRAWLPA